MNKDILIGGALLALLMLGYAIESQPAILVFCLVSILTIRGRNGAIANSARGLLAGFKTAATNHQMRLISQSTPNNRSDPRTQ